MWFWQNRFSIQIAYQPASQLDDYYFAGTGELNGESYRLGRCQNYLPNQLIVEQVTAFMLVYCHLYNKRTMLGHTWRHSLGGVALNAIRYLALCVALLPIWLLFGVSANEPVFWEKMLWYVLFPLAGFPWPESTAGIVIGLLLNAVLWGGIVQLLTQLRFFKRMQR